jgi:hypothetical protein
MPKKKSKEPEEEFDIKEFDELDKLFNKDALNEEDKADQEEDTELNLGDLEFSQFMQSSEPLMDKAPVLERIAGSQPRPIFVGGIPQTPVGISGEEEKTDEFKYVSGGTGNDEPKYIASDSRISAEPTPIDLMKVGRKQTGMIPQVDQETFFLRSEPQQTELSTPERTWKAERIDIEKAGRRDIFEKEDVKYKPKLP